MRRTRKKYNPVKSLTNLANQSLKHYAVCYTTGISYCSLINIKSRKIDKPSKAVSDLLTDMRHTWSVYLAAFTVNKDNINMTSEQITVLTPCLQSELVEMLNDEHQKLLKTVPKDQLIGAGWLAIPRQYSWEDTDAYHYFELHTDRLVTE